MMQKKVVKASVKATEAKVAETVKEVAKAAEKKAEEISKAVEPVKESAVEAAKKTEVDKNAEAVKKTLTKKASEAKATDKKTVVKAAAKAAEVKPQLIVQYQNNEVNTVVVEERVKAQFISEGHKASTIKKVSIYIKPEEYSAYYVINDKFSGRVDLF
ncbi:MAG: DUF6465 family protein [Lachnobacterium sp.]|nr:DUF6465 family protein [uncultured Agathobacter sp.]MCI7112708.1 DUF6465 family protein [Lachnobacterium sp.]